MKKIKQYKSYEDFISDNIGSKNFPIAVGSGGSMQPFSGATKESIEDSFKELIFHNFKDSEFSLNYLSEDLRKEYRQWVSEFYFSLIKSPKKFSSFWKEYMRKSDRYNAEYEIQSEYHTDEGKRIEYRHGNPGGSKYGVNIGDQWNQKWVDWELRHYPDLIFKLFKSKMSDRLKNEYIQYRKDYAGEEIGYNYNAGGTIVKQTFRSLGTLKSLHIEPPMIGHDMLAECDCGEQFSYENSSKNILWECPGCKEKKHIQSF